MANYTGYLKDKNGNKLINNDGSIGNILVEDIECKNLLDIPPVFSVTAYRKVDVELKAGTYTLSGNITGDTGYTSLISFWKGENEIISIWFSHNTDTSETITIAEDVDKILLYSNDYYNSSKGKISVFNNFQLESGSTATGYTGHKKFGYNSQKSMGNIIVNNIQNKNLFNKTNYIIDTANFVGFNVNLELGETYTLSSNKPLMVAKFAWGGNQADGYEGPQIWKSFTSWTFVAESKTPGSFCNRLFLGITTNTLSTNIADFDSYNIQIEKGTKATNYVSYKEFNNEDNYYVPETKIGTWVDGKPIYRKIILFNSFPVDTARLNFEVSIDTLVQSRCLVSQNNAWKDWRPIPWVYADENTSVYGSPNWAAGYYVRGTTGEVFFQAGVEIQNIQKGFMLIEYTKTTD